MWFFTIAILVIKLYTVTLRAIMYNLCIRRAPDVPSRNSVMDDIFAFTEPCLHYADLVFSLPFHNSCLHRKYIFCTAQLKSCIFADLKEERKMSTYSMWVQACYVCESCIQCIPAMGTVKCCGVGNSHELLRHSLVF